MLAKNPASILKFLSSRKGQLYNINQIARALKISVGSAHKILKEFERLSVVERRPLGNALYYTLAETREAKLLLQVVKMVKE